MAHLKSPFLSLPFALPAFPFDFHSLLDCLLFDDKLFVNLFFLFSPDSFLYLGLLLVVEHDAPHMLLFIKKKLSLPLCCKRVAHRKANKIYLQRPVILRTILHDQ